MAVRTNYALDATDEELVTLGTAALRIAHDPRETAPVRLNAMGRFLAIAKQLDLPALLADAIPAPLGETPVTAPPARLQRPGVDPRNVLQAVK